MKRFKSYSKDKFERELTVIKDKNSDIRYWRDITAEVEKNSDNGLGEYVYCFITTKSDLEILIYSSIDRATDRSREIGEDAVRVVAKLNKDGKVQYPYSKSHPRIETVFKNMAKSIKFALQV